MLKASDGRYVSAMWNGGGEVQVFGEQPDAWEYLEVFNQSNSWEPFTVEKLNNWHQNGMSVGFMLSVYNNRWPTVSQALFQIDWLGVHSWNP